MPGLSLWSCIGPKTPPGSMVTIRIRSWRPAMPSISGPRSTVASNLTVTPFVSGATNSLLIVLSSLYFEGLTAWVRGAVYCVSRWLDGVSKVSYGLLRHDLFVLAPPSKPKQADAPGGRNVYGAPPGESAPWAPSTGTCSLRPSARASRPPWRRRTDAPGYRPAGSGRASD